MQSAGKARQQSRCCPAVHRRPVGKQGTSHRPAKLASFGSGQQATPEKATGNDAACITNTKKIHTNKREIEKKELRRMQACAEQQQQQNYPDTVAPG